MSEIIHYMIFAFGLVFVAYVFFWCGVNKAQGKRLNSFEKHELKRLIIEEITIITDPPPFAPDDAEEKAVKKVRELLALLNRIEREL